jgi:hypothetical protein
MVEGKAEIMRFHSAHPEIEHHWKVILTKVFNEKRTIKIGNRN